MLFSTPASMLKIDLSILYWEHENRILKRETKLSEFIDVLF